MKQHLKSLILTSIVTLLPLPLGLFLWDRLPTKLPVHWNLSGEIDGWSDKAFVIIGLPLILLVAQWLCVLATLTDPHKKNVSNKIRHLTYWIIPVLSLVLFPIIYATALGKSVRTELFLSVFVGLLFIIIGNYLPKCSQNYTIGIKLPWTLNSQENWRRTHRFAGPVSIVCGFTVMLLGIFGLWPWSLLPLSVMLLLPTVYSYLLHRKGI